MNRNQKIALGCGGAGCLGLIVLVIVGVVGYLFWMRQATHSRDLDYIVNSNRNRNSDTDSNSSRPNVNASSNTSDSNSSSSSSSSLTDDEKHRLYQAASMTADAELLRRVTVKLGLTNEDYSPSDEYAGFLKDHIMWAYRNGDFIQSLDSKEKALAYVNSHFPE